MSRPIHFLAGRTLGSAFWKALNLDRPIKRIVITADIDAPVTVDVQFVAETKDAEPLADVMKRYRLVDTEAAD